ncbi:hypothetical protein PHK61_23695 [Actinomycetospora lutea]|uniref:hypothetical protein n=1 Tax=Actinomycetospora lutea TaxID=663604 RepID=UPI0023673B9F|nr:hypothetical protein [Actinomycetospora lutea]MDD7941430.1 hypothetical protein [Actinomycetospora lutea]
MPPPQRGAVAPDLAAEFPGLGLWWVAVDVAPRAREDGRARLRRLSDDYRPRDALSPGGRPAAHDAARVFARQVGLDPDGAGLRPDAVARESALAGHLVSRGPVADALLAVAVTSGVTLAAVDARGVTGSPGLRASAAGETVGGLPLPPGTLVVADDRRALARLFADPPHDLRPRRARGVVLWAVEVPGAPPWETEEAVWQAGRFLAGD